MMGSNEPHSGGAGKARNINEDAPWSEMDRFDLLNGIMYGRTVGELADFLCRRADEVLQKARQLGMPFTAPADR